MAARWLLHPRFHSGIPHSRKEEGSRTKVRGVSQSGLGGFHKLLQNSQPMASLLSQEGLGVKCIGNFNGREMQVWEWREQMWGQCEESPPRLPSWASSATVLTFLGSVSTHWLASPVILGPQCRGADLALRGAWHSLLSNAFHISRGSRTLYSRPSHEFIFFCDQVRHVLK